MITPKLLKSWNPCAAGYKRFLQLFPDGTNLQLAIDALVDDGHDDWGYWLFCECKRRGLYQDITVRGYWNSGDRNSGNWNSGDWNSGDRNSGNWNSGDWNSGDRNSGYWNSGDRNSGYWNSGYWNSGDRNSGYWNSGDRNSGNWNSGDRNSGDWNSGNWNSGDRNSGDWNSGNWNSGNLNSGFFNTTTPSTVRVFGIDVPREVWDACYKPNFLYFHVVQWVATETMTAVEKSAYPSHVVTGGYLQVSEYRDAFRQSWDRADPDDRIKIKAIPGFNAEMFYEISGIDLRDQEEP